MKLNIISQNLQGLNDLEKVDIVRNYYKSLLRSVDVLCFQEHKLRGGRLLALHTKIWSQAGSYAREAAVGYNHIVHERGASKGRGVYVGISQIEASGNELGTLNVQPCSLDTLYRCPWTRGRFLMCTHRLRRMNVAHYGQS